MNPWQILGAAAIALVLAAGGFGAGWTVNGWRLGKDAETERADRAENTVAEMGAALDRFGMKVEEVSAIVKSGMENQVALAAAAKRGSDEINSWLAIHDGCRVTDDDVRLLVQNDELRRTAVDAKAAR